MALDLNGRKYSIDVSNSYFFSFETCPNTKISVGTSNVEGGQGTSFTWGGTRDKKTGAYVDCCPEVRVVRRGVCQDVAVLPCCSIQCLTVSVPVSRIDDGASRRSAAQRAHQAGGGLRVDGAGGTDGAGLMEEGHSTTGHTCCQNRVTWRKNDS